METRITAKTAARRAVDAMLVEFLEAYQEAGKLYAKTTDAETRRTVLEMKRCLDLAFTLLAPLDAPSETRLEKLRVPFSS